MMGIDNRPHLSLREKAGFGVCDLGGNLFFTAMGFWTLNYLTDTVALSAAAAGFAYMIGKVWDAIIDPVVGYISDHTHTRWGRRRPFILFAALPMGLAAWFFFTNPHIENKALLTAWATFALCLLNTAYSFVNIPYSSLTPELTKDYHERTSLNGFRFGFAVVGTILGAAIVLPIVGLFPDRSMGFSAAGLIMGAIMVATALVTFFSVREPMPEGTAVSSEGFFKTYLAVFKNRAYVIILFAYALNIVAINFLQGILVYYFKYVYHAEGMTTIAMVILLAIAMVMIPISVPVSKRIGKRLTYQIGLSILAVVCITLYFLGHVLGIGFFFGMMSLAGIGLGLSYVAPWAMVPDAIEWDAVTTGNRKEGAYYGMWTFITQCGQALSIGLMGVLLEASGYVAEAEQTAGALKCIRLFLGPVPALVFILGTLLLVKYPITEKVYEALFTARESRT
jgi:GPH family glycoside/pentoside/hexuronide:cation symporter